jgi:hypothetical protein
VSDELERNLGAGDRGVTEVLAILLSGETEKYHDQKHTHMGRIRNHYPYVRFEVFTEVTMKDAVFWYVALCISWVNRRFGGMYCLVPRSRIFLP